MERVSAVPRQGGGVHKGGIQHQVGVGAGQTAGLDPDLQKARDLPRQTLQAGFDPACLRFSPEYYDILGLEGPEREEP